MVASAAMPEVHLPHLDDHDDAPVAAGPAPAHAARGKSILNIALEVVLISAGVFLGLAGEQWRETTHRRELAHATLERFRTEVLDNRKAVLREKDYHVALRTSLHAYFDAPPAKRASVPVDIEGVRPVAFETTAWDLAIGTQSLADLDPPLAY